jgi:1,4-alpha-glucan branching enzyme
MILHAHLPYIRHHDRDDYMEERWFYEAMTETYLPILDVFDRLIEEGVQFRITMTMTPTLLALLEDPLMYRRYTAHLNRLVGLAKKEMMRLTHDAEFLPLARLYLERFQKLRNLYQTYQGNLIQAFKRLQDLGFIEIITSAATHAFLPLLRTEEALRAQIMTAVRDYERHFGRPPKGIWLPECGYTLGVDRILKQAGIDYFIADTTAVEFARPRPNRGLFAPLMTPYGVHAFARDPQSAGQVWNARNGYPGDYDYREYYRDIGWDLGWKDKEEWDYIRPYVLPTHERVNTGIKYYRITGPGKDKDSYKPLWAEAKAAEHAGNFMFNREQEIEHISAWLDRKPLIVSPYDAELFGHWWFEGPIWIEMLCRKIYYDQRTLSLITPSEYLREYPLSDTAILNDSSWGRNHSNEVWLQGNNDWIYRHLHQAEERIIQLATIHGKRQLTVEDGLLTRALNQAAKELMLAQGSDWAFIMDAKTVVEYACNRTKNHLIAFHRLCDMVDHNHIHVDVLTEYENQNPLFPDIQFIDYLAIPVAHSHQPGPAGLDINSVIKETVHLRNIFMMTWEYPPKNIGGLSRAVCELSEALAERGDAIHVVTTSHYGAPYFEKVNGVYIHRIPILTSGQTDFYEWTFEMNVAMIDYLIRWKEGGGRIDLLHAHDWMVCEAARELKLSYQIPLVATIHATEWGRQGGQLYTDLQRRIHGLDWALMYEAAVVLVCSRFMRDEIQSVFQLPPDKIHIVPNGISIDAANTRRRDQSEKYKFVSPDEKMIFFVGRLVFEKGIHILIEAMPSILAAVPKSKLIIAGHGPMEYELRQQAAYLGDRVQFVGFVEDEQKESLFRSADVCVFPSLYEPFGIVALEAMKYKTPLIVTDTGGFTEIVQHDKEGYTALPGHTQSLAWHVSEMLLHPEQADQMAEAAHRKLFAEYAWGGIANKMMRIYDDITSANQTVIVQS